MTDEEYRGLANLLNEVKVDVASIKAEIKGLTSMDTGIIPAFIAHFKIVDVSLSDHSKQIARLEIKADWLPTRNRLVLIGIGTIVTIGGLMYALVRAIIGR